MPVSSADGATTGVPVPRRLLIALLLCCMPLLAAASCERPWRVAFDDWRPYSFIDAEGRHTGLETELLHALAREMGCTVEYVRELPLNRRLPMLAAGELDLLVAASFDGPDTSDRTWFTRPYRDEEFSAFMRAGAARVMPQSLAHALESGLRLLAHRGPSVVAAVDAFAARGRLTLFEGYAKGVQLLKYGRGDLLLGDRLAVLFAANAAGVDVVELALPVRRDVVAYKLSRQRFDEADVSHFNEAILRLDAQGELRRIRTRWLSPPARPRPVGPGASAARR
ncbi:MAG: transporter substrate-binding domain-containing protein [Rubrivivax sp.]|nr:MAG: transporter substrate-binding domain-containing protein [Rubrivivax sp.]